MSIFIFQFKSGGKLSSWPVYSPNAYTAETDFHRRMGNFGMEYDKYKIVGVREIPESQIQFSVHLKQVARLTPEDRRQFFSDRKERQLRNKGRVDKFVQAFFDNGKLEILCAV